MKKRWFQSKTVWGMILFTVFGLSNLFYPDKMWDALILLALGWSGYGLRDALK